MVRHYTKIQKIQAWRFLKVSFWLGITAFGGPQMHIPLFIKRFVDKNKFLTREELLDIVAFCSVLPGPSSTQTLTAVGFKLGGPRLAFLSLLCWILPGFAAITAFVLIPALNNPKVLRFMQPMAAAFLVYAAVNMFMLIRKDKVNYLICIVCAAISYFLRSPVVFPVAILLGGILSARYGNRTYTPNTTKFGPVRLANFSLFLGIIVVVAITGLLLVYNMQERYGRPLVLFENTYRIGALSFGGGNGLAAMVFEQYVLHKPRISTEELNIGLGLVNGLPGPNFNLAAYVNGMSMKNYGYNHWGQLLGCGLGVVAIFLPGILLLFFAFPFWDRLKTYPLVQRSLDGIFASTVGFVVSAAVIINLGFWTHYIHNPVNWQYFIVFAVVVLALFSRKVASPLIVLGTILAGLLIPL